MFNHEGHSDYHAKADGYFEDARAEMLPLVPASCRRALDVGCGSGSFAALLRSSRNIEVWGVEPFATAAAQATTRIDRVIEGIFDARTPLPESSFDCIVFNDVLEHMLDPAAALHRARSLLTPGGIVIASIPNIRHFPTVWRLAVHDEWQYRDCGTLDKTHFRFFTKSSIREMFETAGYSIETLHGIRPYQGVPNVSKKLWDLYKLANVVCLQRFDDMKYERFAIVAKLAKLI